MVGLSQDAMAMWCNVSMQPLIDAYNDIIHLNMSVSRHIMIEWRFGKKIFVCSSDEINIRSQSKFNRFCHLVALLLHKESCLIPALSLIPVLSYMLSLHQMGPLTGNATAERIVKIVQSFYQASINHTLVTQRLIMNFSSLFSVWMGQPLNPGAQHHWYKQLQSLNVENR